MRLHYIRARFPTPAARTAVLSFPRSRASKIALLFAFGAWLLAAWAGTRYLFKTDPLDALDDELNKMPALRDLYDEAVDTCVGECQVERLSETTVVLRGRIHSPETYDALMGKLDERVTDLVVNMIGGDVETALKIADEIERKQLKVVVQGFCLSSCANYLFLAGHEKVLHGILGYHGSAQGAYRDGVARGDNPSHRVPALEKVFFTRIGISERLFDVTQSNNKGFDRGIGMYAPSAATLRALGVKNIVGDQDEALLAQADLIFRKTRYKFMSFGRDPNPAFADLLAPR